MLHSTVPQASVRVMCRLAHSSSSGKRQKSPAATPQMCGRATSEHESEAKRGAKTMPSMNDAPFASSIAEASSMPVQKLAARRLWSSETMSRCRCFTPSDTTAASSGCPGSLSGADSPLSVPSGKFSQSWTCTRNELCDSSLSRVMTPSAAAIESATARACLVGGRQPKPPLSTRRPPM